MDTLSDELLIKVYKEAKTYKLNSDFIHLLEDELLRRIAVKMIEESKTQDIAKIKSLPIDSDAVDVYFNLA